MILSLYLHCATTLIRSICDQIISSYLATGNTTVSIQSIIRNLNKYK